MWKGVAELLVLAVEREASKPHVKEGGSELQSPANAIFQGCLWGNARIGLKFSVLCRVDEPRRRPEMQREVAHQTNLLELSLGGHSALNELLTQGQSSVREFTGMLRLMRYDLHAWLCKDSCNKNTGLNIEPLLSFVRENRL